MRLKKCNKWDRKSEDVQGSLQRQKIRECCSIVGWKFGPGDVVVLEELFCSLYGLKEEISNIEARYRLFTIRKKVQN